MSRKWQLTCALAVQAYLTFVELPERQECRLQTAFLIQAWTDFKL